MLKGRPDLLELFQGSQHELLVVEHADCIVGLHRNFYRSERGVDSSAASVNHLSSQRVLLDAMLHCIGIVVLRVA